MLRASHRALDEQSSKWTDAQGERVLIRPYHPHRDPKPLDPGKAYRLEIEVFPVGNVFRQGHKLSLSISQPPLIDPVPIAFGKKGSYKYESNQPPGTVTIHRSAEYPSSILLPLLPSLPPISENPVDVGDQMGIQLKKNDGAGVGTENPQTAGGRKDSSRTSENVPRIKKFFQRYPSADANGDGVLTEDEKRRYRKQP